MATYSLPGVSGWKQYNVDDVSGSLFATKNMDLSDGRLKLAKRMTAFATSDDFPGMGLVMGGCITRADYNKVFFSAMASDGAFAGVITADQFLENVALNTTSGFPSPTGTFDAGQCIGFPDTTFSSTTAVPRFAQGTTLKSHSFNGDTWTASYSTLSALYQHPVCIYPKTGKLMVGDGAVLKTIDTANTVVSFSSLIPPGYIIKDIIADSSRVYIISNDVSLSNKAILTIWDGSASTPTSLYDTESPFVVGGCLSSGIIYIYSMDGELKRFNGTGFETVAVMPFSKSMSDSNAEGYIDGIGYGINYAIKSNAIGGVYIILQQRLYDYSFGTPSVTSYSNRYDKVNQNILSGVWEWNSDVGIYHKYAPSYATNKDAPTDFGAVSSKYSKAGGILVFPRAGEVNAFAARPSGKGSELALGASYRNLDSEVVYTDVICSATRGVNIGYAITPKINTASQTENFNKVIVKFDNHYTLNTRLRLKYKTVTSKIFPMTLDTATKLWTSANSFETDDLRASYIQVGNEVILTHGTNAGESSYVTSVTELSGVYTVTIKDNIRPEASYTSDNIVIDAFTLLQEMTGDKLKDTSGVMEVDIPDKNISQYIQLKVEIKSDEQVIINSINVSTTVNKPI